MAHSRILHLEHSRSNEKENNIEFHNLRKESQMIKIEDLNHVTDYLLAMRGPKEGVEIRQTLNRIVKSAKLVPQERAIYTDFYQPMREIANMDEEWQRNHPDRQHVVHLYYSGDLESPANRELRRRWEEIHLRIDGGQVLRVEIVDHEFIWGNSSSLSDQQKEEVDRILNDGD